MRNPLFRAPLLLCSAMMKWLLPVLALILGLHTPAAYGWSAPGHLISAALAYDELSPEERARVDEVLKSHPKYAIWTAAYPESGLPDISREKFIVMLAAAYPDEIRNHDNPETFPNWHYIDYPLYPPDFPMKPAPTPGDDVLYGIDRAGNAVAKLLRPEDAVVRAKMLSFVLHLVGDLHQPLHCETLFNEKFLPPEGDRGGNNAFVVNAEGHRVKLHALWDQLFGPGPQLFRPVPLTMVIASSNNAKRLKELFKRSDLPEIVEHNTAEAWALESRTASIEDVWKRGTIPYSIEGEPAPAPLPEGYEAHAKEVADRRVALAGYRLADRLRTLLP